MKLGRFLWADNDGNHIKKYIELFVDGLNVPDDILLNGQNIL